MNRLNQNNRFKAIVMYHNGRIKTAMSMQVKRSMIDSLQGTLLFAETIEIITKDEHNKIFNEAMDIYIANEIVPKSVSRNEPKPNKFL